MALAPGLRECAERAVSEDLSIVLPPDFVEAIAERVAEILAERTPRVTETSPYLTVAEAATFLRCSKQRIYDLLSARRLTRHKDGRRVLVARSEIERHIARGAAPRVAPALPSTHRALSGKDVAARIGNR
jgi:excisionase family DNA binding protein